jgi:hypothetical protein
MNGCGSFDKYWPLPITAALPASQRLRQGKEYRAVVFVLQQRPAKNRQIRDNGQRYQNKNYQKDFRSLRQSHYH